MFEGLSIYDFQGQFSVDESCTDLLVFLKWGDTYSCRNCGYQKYCTTKRYGERRCCSCGKPESATAHTLFHKLKFPIHKAFMMLYLISTTKKEKLVVVGIERFGRGIYKAYAREIPSAGVKDLKPFFEDHISKEANIKTDGWRSYKSLKNDYKKLTQVKSNKGKNFDAMHRLIMTMKSWLRGIPGSVRDLQPYLDEYMYKFNRHKSGGNIFNLILKRMVNFPAVTYSKIFNVT